MGWRRKHFAPPWKRWHKHHHGGPPVVVPPDRIPGTLGFLTAAVTIPEDIGTFTVDVARDKGTDGAVGVSWSIVPGTAIPGIDYPYVSSLLNGQLNWTDGDAQPKRISLPINRTLLVGDATFSVVLSNPTGGAALGPSTVAVTIDRNVNGVISFTPGTWAIQDPGGGPNVPIVVTVERGQGLKNAVTVDWATENGSATAGVDYVAGSGTLSWADGDGAAKSISVDVIPRLLDNGTRSFTIRLLNPTGGATIAGPTTPVTIQETAPGSLPSPGAHPSDQIVDVFSSWRSTLLMDSDLGMGREDILINTIMNQKIGTVIGGGGTDLTNGDPGFGPPMPQRIQATILYL